MRVHKLKTKVVFLYKIQVLKNKVKKFLSFGLFLKSLRRMINHSELHGSHYILLLVTFIQLCWLWITAAI